MVNGVCWGKRQAASCSATMCTLSVTEDSGTAWDGQYGDIDGRHIFMAGVTVWV